MTEKILLAQVILLSCIILFQHVLFLTQIHRLVDKLMSRNYLEYRSAQEPLAKRMEVNLPQETPDDLRPLQEFSLGP